MSLPENLPHKCDITKSDHTIDEETGADLDTPVAFASDVDCWIQPISASAAAPFQRRDQNVTHKVYFKGNPGIRPGFIITPKDGRTACPFTGATLEVKAIQEASAGTGLLWRVTCEEIQPR